MASDVSPRGSIPPRARLIEAAVRGLSALLGRLPWSVAQRIGRGIGSLTWHLGRRDRRRALEHLAIAYPEQSEDERIALARACFRHHGTTLAELLHLRHRNWRQLASHIVCEGWEHIAEARRRGQSVLIVSGHCGNWEMLAALTNGRGRDLPPDQQLALSVIARSWNEPNLNRIMVDLRRRFGSETIERGQPDSARRLLGVLRRGDALALLIDQDTDVDGVWVPFFGRLAFTPSAAAKLGRRPKVAVIPTFSERLADGRHRVTFRPPVDLPQDEREGTARLTAEIERQVRKCPEQWVWMHRRWRRRPPVEETPAG
ncbi:MAG: lysophospholipid acyltransferase family protein [Acidobacteriota bacterium]